LKADPPWSPTGVAIHGDDVYVLEYSNANSDQHEDWQPRVRKLGKGWKGHDASDTFKRLERVMD
jgi:hypothetical protein